MKRSKQKQAYQEGDWFGVPLQSGGYGVGLIARAPGNGVVLGYFFGIRYEEPPKEESVKRLSGNDTILVTLFGDAGLIQGRWPIIARTSPWNHNEWPVPAFGRTLEIEGKTIAWRVEYSNADLVHIVRETRTSPQAIQGLPEEGLWGHLALEEYLTKLLTK